ncbi:MAG: hypothetical protein ACFBQW_08660 [Sphingomonadaceae bacterium]
MVKALLPAALVVLAAGLAGCTSYYDDYGYDYGHEERYGDYRGDDDYRDYAGGIWVGERPGALDPWLSETEEGREIVARRFGEGLSREERRRANIWFRRYADSDDDLRLTDAEIRVALAFLAGL